MFLTVVNITIPIAFQDTVMSTNVYLIDNTGNDDKLQVGQTEGKKTI